jgi:predicted aspartyl protease
MESAVMGKVVVAAKIENLADLLQAQQGTLPPDQVRHLDITDALVDTGAVYLSLPRRWVEQLGLQKISSPKMRTTAGAAEAGVYGTVRLTVQDRFCTVDVLDVPDDCPALIGQVPLELMDFVVDPKNRRLMGNPEHGGEWMHDQF